MMKSSRRSNIVDVKLRALIRAAAPGHRAELRHSVTELLDTGVQSMTQLTALTRSRRASPQTRRLACWAVGHLRPRGWTTILGHALKADASEEVVHAAVQALTRTRSSGAVRALRSALVGGSAALNRAEAAWGLGTVRARASVPSLIRTLRKPGEDRRVKAEVAEALGYMGQRASIKPLMSLLDHPDPLLRYQALFGLGSLADRTTLPAIERLLDDDAEVGVHGGRDYGRVKDAAHQAKRSIKLLNRSR